MSSDPTPSVSPAIRIGIAGLGRSGWGIHAHALEKVSDVFCVMACSDPDTARGKEAEERFGCRSYLASEQLFEDPDLEAIVVATPSTFHGPHAKLALQNGKHVVVEKPIASDLQEFDEIVACAKQHGRLFAPFQNRRLDATFLKINEIVQSGVLGKLLLIRICEHGFKRRWDWQTMRHLGGGLLNNWGPHLIDQALALWPNDAPEPEILCDLRRGLASGDAEDHVKIVLKNKGLPTIDIEISSVAAFSSDSLTIFGTSGGLRVASGKLEWKTVDWSLMPERPVQLAPPPERNYGSETLDWKQETWAPPANTFHLATDLFYRNLARAIRGEEELAIAPETVRTRIALLEKCRGFFQPE